MGFQSGGQMQPTESITESPRESYKVSTVLALNDLRRHVRAPAPPATTSIHEHIIHPSRIEYLKSNEIRRAVSANS